MDTPNTNKILSVGRLLLALLSLVLIFVSHITYVGATIPGTAPVRQITFGAATDPESLGSLESEKAGLISTVSLEQRKPREDQKEAEKGKREGGEEEELSSPCFHSWLHL